MELHGVLLVEQMCGNNFLAGFSFISAEWRK